jgi:methylenetetrahydrofolate--tRNA-(uracil-5-)-methyltransferase
VNSPRCLLPTLEVRARPGLTLAGQMAGVEGYVESAALGLLAGIQVARAAQGLPVSLPPDTSAHGALLGHLQRADARRFQPMNATFGLFPPLPDTERRATRRERHARMAERALTDLAGWAAKVAPEPATG